MGISMATSSKYLSFSLAARFEDLPESTLPNVSWKRREPFSMVQAQCTFDFI